MSDAAVVVVDMMNTYQHADAEDLIPNVEKIMDPPADLVRRARDDFVRSAHDGARPDLIKPILPAPISGTTACLTKVRHSAFYTTPLAICLGAWRPSG
jgi:hypothetical protein